MNVAVTCIATDLFSSVRLRARGREIGRGDQVWERGAWIHVDTFRKHIYVHTVAQIALDVSQLTELKRTKRCQLQMSMSHGKCIEDGRTYDVPRVKVRSSYTFAYQCFVYKTVFQFN